MVERASDHDIPVFLVNERISEPCSGAFERGTSRQEQSESDELLTEDLGTITPTRIGVSNDELCCGFCDATTDLWICNECEGGKILCKTCDDTKWHSFAKRRNHRRDKIIDGSINQYVRSDERAGRPSSVTPAISCERIGDRSLNLSVASDVEIVGQSFNNSNKSSTTSRVNMTRIKTLDASSMPTVICTESQKCFKAVPNSLASHVPTINILPNSISPNSSPVFAANIMPNATYNSSAVSALNALQNSSEFLRPDNSIGQDGVKKETLHQKSYETPSVSSQNTACSRIKSPPERSTSADASIHDYISRIKYPPSMTGVNLGSSTLPTGASSRSILNYSTISPEMVAGTAVSMHISPSAIASSFSRPGCHGNSSENVRTFRREGEKSVGQKKASSRQCSVCTLENSIDDDDDGQIRLCKACNHPLPASQVESINSLSYFEPASPLCHHTSTSPTSFNNNQGDDIIDHIGSTSGSLVEASNLTNDPSYSFIETAEEEDERSPSESFSFQSMDSEKEEKRSQQRLKHSQSKSLDKKEESPHDAGSTTNAKRQEFRDKSRRQVDSESALLNISSISLASPDDQCSEKSKEPVHSSPATTAAAAINTGMSAITRSLRNLSTVGSSGSFDAAEKLREIERATAQVELSTNAKRVKIFVKQCYTLGLTHAEVVEILKQCPSDYDPEYLKNLWHPTFQSLRQDALAQGCLEESDASWHETCWALLRAGGNAAQALANLRKKHRNQLDMQGSVDWCGLDNFAAYVSEKSSAVGGRPQSLVGEGEGEQTSIQNISSSSSEWFRRSVSRVEDLVVIMRDSSSDYKRKVRMIMCECGLSWARAAYVHDILLDPSLPPEIQFCDILSSAKEATSKADMKNRVMQECEICYTTHPPGMIRSLSGCQCKICIECLVRHFEIVIRERYVRNLTCPMCQKPDISACPETETHFQFLSHLLHGLLPSELYELFQTKLRDWNLMMEPLFRWCVNISCKTGFLMDHDNTLKVHCPTCRKAMCQQCKKPWESQHDNISCDDFQSWKEANDPERLALGLARHLEENGIECPQCKCRYSLAKGGCMHFTCMQCRHDFCSGCSRPFRHSRCEDQDNCTYYALHCHHPRNCLYYLRDYTVIQLQTLLREHHVPYDTKVAESSRSDRLHCSVLEQKQTNTGFVDEACGKQVPKNFAGLCEVHYKEYLVSLINKRNIDPVSIMEINEMLTVLNRVNKIAPKRNSAESDQSYRLRLLQIIRDQVPLPQRIGAGANIRLSGRDETAAIHRLVSHRIDDQFIMSTVTDEDLTNETLGMTSSLTPAAAGYGYRAAVLGPSSRNRAAGSIRNNAANSSGLFAAPATEYGYETATPSEYGYIATAPSEYGYIAAAPSEYGYRAGAPSEYGYIAAAPSEYGYETAAPFERDDFANSRLTTFINDSQPQVDIFSQAASGRFYVGEDDIGTDGGQSNTDDEFTLVARKPSNRRQLPIVKMNES